MSVGWGTSGDLQLFVSTLLRGTFLEYSTSQVWFTGNLHDGLLCPTECTLLKGLHLAREGFSPP